MMDAYNFYLSTFRYVMNANPEDKATWRDIFGYIPCLRQMLSCCVCGSILLRPYGPTHGVCLHHVCQGCIGGRMRLKPSCSWCKDHNPFQENKKLRVLIICFKRLCAYVSHSTLGAEILKASINGYGSEAEKTMKILEEADQFQDDYILTPAPTELPVVSKSGAGGVKSSVVHVASTSMLHVPSSSASNSGTPVSAQPFKRKRGRPKSIPRLAGKVQNTKTNISEHVKRLKKRALNSKSNNAMKRPFMKANGHQKRYERKQQSVPDSSGLLISQRPHRDRSNKSSVGQLWRETFLEDVQPESYPDSGIEVGNSSDHDHYSQPPQLTRLEHEKVDSGVAHAKPEVIRKETRHHRHANEDQPETSVNDVTSTTDETVKPRLTLTISKKRFQNFGRKGRAPTTVSYRNLRDSTAIQSKATAFSLAHGAPRLKKSNTKSGSSRAAKRTDICKCARFKQPNQLTCFGQKCPCYSEKRACVDCLCNGCKNPLKTPDSAPPLMHIIKDSDGLDRSFDRSMPRLSPIPRI